MKSICACSLRVPHSPLGSRSLRHSAGALTTPPCPALQLLSTPRAGDLDLPQLNLPQPASYAPADSIVLDRGSGFTGVQFPNRVAMLPIPGLSLPVLPSAPCACCPPRPTILHLHYEYVICNRKMQVYTVSDCNI